MRNNTQKLVKPLLTNGCIYKRTPIVSSLSQHYCNNRNALHRAYRFCAEFCTIARLCIPALKSLPDSLNQTPALLLAPPPPTPKPINASGWIIWQGYRIRHIGTEFTKPLHNRPAHCPLQLFWRFITKRPAFITTAFISPCFVLRFVCV